MTVRAMVIRAAGTNCDGETVAALEAAGAETTRVHVNRLAAEPGLLDGPRILVLAGGFTFGDDVASGWKPLFEPLGLRKWYAWWDSNPRPLPPQNSRPHVVLYGCIRN